MTIVACPNCGTKNRVDERRTSDSTPRCGRCGAALPMADGGGGVMVLTDANFITSLAGPGPLLVDCWAAWCGPCRMIAPVIEQLAAEAGGRYRVGKLNVDENPAVAGQFQIQSIPTLLIFKDAKLVDSIVGLAPKAAIAAKLAQWA